MSSLRDPYGNFHLTRKAVTHCLKKHWDSISLRDPYSHFHLTGKAIVQCLKAHWDSISEPSRVGTLKLLDSFGAFLPFPKLGCSLALFLKRADQTLVHTALDEHKDGRTPGLDGLSANVYKTFELFLVPLIHHTYTYLLGWRSLQKSWSMGV